MKIGMITDSLGGLDFAALIRTAAELGIEMLEFSGGNWSKAPHLQHCCLRAKRAPSLWALPNVHFQKTASPPALLRALATNCAPQHWSSPRNSWC